MADAWQRMGLGCVLMETLLESARDAGYARAVADIQPDNKAMLALGRTYDFASARSPHGWSVVRLVRDFRDPLPADEPLISASVSQPRPSAPFAALQ